MNTKLTSLIGGLLALALIASACGGGSDEASSADQPLIDAVAAQMREDGDMPESVDAECMAAAVVNGFGGAEAMEANFGLTVDTITSGQEVNDVALPKDEAIALSSEAMDCGLGEIILAELTGGEDGMDTDDATCLFEKIDQDVIRDMLATDFMNDADAAEVEEAAEGAMFSSIIDAISECDIDPSALGL